MLSKERHPVRSYKNRTKYIHMCGYIRVVRQQKKLNKINQNYIHSKLKINKMGIFKKLFGSKSADSKPQISNVNKKTIYDFFKIDIANMPDEDFIKGGIEESENGDEIHLYRKSLNYKECGLFDTIEIKLIGDNGKNISFKTFEPGRVNFSNLKSLIDDLYLIYGNDDSNKGRFNSKDKQDYNDDEFFMLFGRMWMDSKHEKPVMINRDEDEFSFNIWDSVK